MNRLSRTRTSLFRWSGASKEYPRRPLVSLSSPVEVKAKEKMDQNAFIYSNSSLSSTLSQPQCSNNSFRSISSKAQGNGRRSFSTVKEPGAAQQGKTQLVFDVTESDFAEKVMQQTVPVILDIHAEWCGPCKQLGPILEAAVRAQNGKVVMAKLDADQNPSLTQQLRVSSLPTVLAVNEGKLVDNFTGMIPEAQVKEFVSKLANLSGNSAGAEEQDPIKVAQITLEKTSASLQEQPATPEMLQVLKSLAEFEVEKGSQPNDVNKEDLKEIKARALALLAKCAFTDGHIESANTLCEQIQQDYPSVKHPEISQILASVKLANDAPSSSEFEQLKSKLEADPKDTETLLKISNYYVSQGNHEEAINYALKLMRVNKSYGDGAAKQLLLDVFDVLGPDHELTKNGRRRMSSLLLV